MSGAFQTSREIFENPIWKNIVEFRLFFLIYGSAVFSEEGYRVSDDLVLQRGQWLRSTRKLQEDLTFIENRQVKTYSTSVLHRAIVSLVKAQRICTRKHELGTVFMVNNYDQYQGFMNYRKDNMERNLEQHQNSVGTVLEQSGNNNKKVKKDNKVNKDITKREYAEKVTLTDDQYQKLIGKYGTEEIVKSAIERLNNYKCSKVTKYTSDYHVLIGWVFDDFEKRKLTVLKGGAQRDQGRQNVRSGGNQTKGGISPADYQHLVVGTPGVPV